MAGWRSRRSWPPSPSVEDEDESLAHEITNRSPTTAKSADDEAQSKGSVDQYPIILDVNIPESKHLDGSVAPFDSNSVSSQSSDDSFGPATPPPSSTGSQRNRTRREDVQPSTATSGLPVRGKEKDTAHIKPVREPIDPRGRLSRIDTNMDSEVRHILSGRTPSPYGMVKPDQEEPKPDKGRYAREVFLSPDAVTSKQSLAPDRKREPSTRRHRERPTEQSSSEDSDKRSHHSRHHSRRRSTIGSFSDFSHHRGETHDDRPREDHRTHSHHLHPDSTFSDKENHSDSREHRHRHHHHDHSDPERRSSKLESPPASSAEEGRSRHRDHSHIRERSRARDKSSVRSRRPSVSSVQSPAIETKSSRYSVDSSPTVEHHDEKTRVRRNSHSRRQDQTPDISSFRRSLPVAAAATAAISTEHTFDKAFKDNKARHRPSPLPSPMASPLSSPSMTPPRTPRADSKGDYFSRTSGLVAPASRPRSRAPSRAGTLDESKVPPSRNTTTPRPIPIPSQSSRSSSSSHYDLPLNQPIPRPSSALPPIIDQHGPHRSGSYVASPVDPPTRMMPRAQSYSNSSEAYQVYSDRSSRPGKVYVVPSQGHSHGPRPINSAPPSQDHVPRLATVNPSSVELPVCPRSVPIAGYHDWYTINGLTQLNFCPTCMEYIGGSRFRSAFIKNHTNTTERIRCALSQPWIRLAWIQTMKQGHTTLKLLHEIVHIPETTKPCPGKKSQIRSWYKIIDPDDGDPVPNFEACSACIRSIDIIFPQVRGVFKRPGGALVQERFCDLDQQSARFINYMNHLETAAVQYETKRQMYPDMRPFVGYARRIARIVECPRDNMVMSQPWHFMPQLPELTICEECFNDFIWPLKDRPIANMVNRSLQLVPGAQRHDMMSCQVYSERMRRIFTESIQSNDFAYLQQAVKRRVKIEHLLMQKKGFLENDIKNGWDRSEEMANLVAQWRKIE